MNILLINHYAGSPQHGMEFRPYYLAREWVGAGHAVTIVAASFSHVRQRQPAVQAAVLDEEIDGIAYRWLPTPAYAGNGLGRARNIWAFLRRLWRDAGCLAATLKPDVVIASSTYPMDIWVARRIAWLARARLVYEVHDLWPASPVELAGMPRWHPFILLCQKAENDAYRDADVVISMLPCVAEHMQAHGLQLSRLHIVPNGIAQGDWQGEAEQLDARLLEHLRAQQAAGRTIVAYAGSHGLPNALDVLLDAARLLENEPFAFVLVGQGMDKPRLAARVLRERIQNVALFEAIPKAQVAALLRGIDIAYIGWQRQAIYRFGIAPNKLMDYMMAGVPVLHSVAAGNDSVAEAGCGLSVPPQDPGAVVAGLRELAALPGDARRAMGERGRRFVLAHHSYGVLAQRFIDAVSPAASA
ncbi:MAG: glycosyltransferase family 4 protein [Burkholderiaceae bacterium]